MQANTHRRILGVLILGLTLGAAPAGAETTICTVISSLPYTISAQGSYCLDRNLSTAMTTGAAITINIDFVVDMKLVRRFRDSAVDQHVCILNQSLQASTAPAVDVGG